MRKILRLTALAGLIAAATPAFADRDKDKADAPLPPVFQAVMDCKTVTDPVQRLACYDRNVGTMVAASQSRDLIVADRATMREARRGLFGLRLPRLKLFGGNDSEEVTQIEGTIASVYSSRDGSAVFVLADGSHWKQTEGRPVYTKSGESIVIEKASLGSYFAKIGKGQNARVARIQ